MHRRIGVENTRRKINDLMTALEKKTVGKSSSLIHGQGGAVKKDEHRAMLLNYTRPVMGYSYP